jgi:hypothetical protein
VIIRHLDEDDSADRDFLLRYRHVLVNGEFVVSGARLVTSARPGRPVRTGL